MKTFKKIHFRKGWWKSLLAAILCIGVVVGAGFGIASIVKPDKVDDFVTYSTLSSTKYRVGGLDGKGNYMNTDQSIYTKDAFECQGLNCTLAFDNDISYQIYFYDQNNEFVHTTGKLTGAFVQDSIPFFAKYARIVITPNDDNKVSKLEVMKYAKQLKTTVYREQGFRNYTENLLTWGTATGVAVSGSTGAVVEVSGETSVASDFVNVSSYKEGLVLRVYQSSGYGTNPIYLYDAEKNYLGFAYIGDVANVFATSEGLTYYGLNLSNIVLDGGGIAQDVHYIRLNGNNTHLPEFYCR